VGGGVGGVPGVVAGVRGGGAVLEERGHPVAALTTVTELGLR